jgi:hypothetical protein
MKRALVVFLPLALAAGAAAAQTSEMAPTPTLGLRSPESPASPPGNTPDLAETKRRATDGLPTKDEETCVIMPIECDSMVDGDIETTDCSLDDGTYADFWTFDGTAGTEVTIDLESDDFDTFLFLLDPVPDVVATDDDGGTGTNSRLVYSLGTSGEWTIVANNFAPGALGAYTLTMSCSAATVQPPAAPSQLVATAVAPDEIDLSWKDNSTDEEGFRVEVASGGEFSEIGTAPADSEAIAVVGVTPGTYTFRIRAYNSAGNSAYSNEATATTPVAGEPCVADISTMCLNNGRFKVQVEWRDFADNTGSGVVVPQGSDDSGLFWFFNSDNWEMLVKVLRGCPVNNHYWVFSAATTNVEYTLRVTDTETGTVKEWTNPLGASSPAITDTQAFATCP